jgi:dihydrofolate reductase
MEIVVAMTSNHVIGQNGDMPWHLPADLVHFKELTSGHAIIMGRRTWESIGKPLPNRLNIVVTRQENYAAGNVTVVHSLEDGIVAAGTKRIFLIGGGEMYKEALPIASQMHITRIDALIEGDTKFPEIDESIWKCKSRVNRSADEKNQYDLVFETWERAN